MGSKRLLSLGLFLTLAFMLTACVDQNPEKTEASAENTENESHAIVATSVAVCDILEALNAEGVVGVPTSDSTLAESFADATEVGAPMSPDIEIISSLNPTLIISPKSLEADLKPQYDELGVQALFMDLSSVSGMYDSITQLGKIIGREGEAEELVSEFNSYMDVIEEKISTADGKRVLILMGLPGSYVVATEYSYVGSLVELVGGENVYAGESTDSFLNINSEDMLSRDPDVILLASHAMPEQVKTMFEEEFATNDIWQNFRATQDGQVFYLDYEMFGMSADFSYPDAIEELINILYTESTEE